MDYRALFLTLPAQAAAGRMRAWRALKALGCATLRDGVYLLPEASGQKTQLDEVAREVCISGGYAEIYLLSGQDEKQDTALRALFDHSADYAALMDEIQALHHVPDASMRKAHGLARRFEQLAKIDYFPCETQRKTLEALQDLQAALAQRQSPGEPVALPQEPARLDRAAYRNRIWATRARPWVDRLASAWLIRRFIDPDARIVWLKDTADCQPDWLGFDFDGAAFSHIGPRVSFETLLFCFSLEENAELAWLGKLVHSLDVGGLPIAEAAGVEALLTGLCATETDDDTLLAHASKLFDYLLQSRKEQTT